MGWFGSRDSLSQQKTSILQDLNSAGHRVLDVKSTRYGRRFWVAVEHETGGQFIMLYLFERHNGEWMYKPMEETCGPCYYDCPMSLLAMTDDGPRYGFSQEWRDSVGAYHRGRTKK